MLKELRNPPKGAPCGQFWSNKIILVVLDYSHSIKQTPVSYSDISK